MAHLSLMRAAGGMSLVEVLLAVVVLATLGVAIQSTMIGTLSGVQIDRASELKRRICLDILERFGTPYTDIASLFPPDASPPAGPFPTRQRELKVEEALALIGMPKDEAAVVKQVLGSANVSGFNVAWTKGQSVGTPTSPATTRLDSLWCFAVVSRKQPGVSADAFRLFMVRGR